MNRSNLVAETKVLISFAVTASLFEKGVKPALHRGRLHGQNVLLHGRNVA